MIEYSISLVSVSVSSSSNRMKRAKSLIASHVVIDDLGLMVCFHFICGLCQTRSKRRWPQIQTQLSLPCASPAIRTDASSSSDAPIARDVKGIRGCHAKPGAPMQRHVTRGAKSVRLTILGRGDVRVAAVNRIRITIEAEIERHAFPRRLVQESRRTSGAPAN